MKIISAGPADAQDEGPDDLAHASPGRPTAAGASARALRPDHARAPRGSGSSPTSCESSRAVGAATNACASRTRAPAPRRRETEWSGSLPRRVCAPAASTVRRRGDKNPRRAGRSPRRRVDGIKTSIAPDGDEAAGRQHAPGLGVEAVEVEPVERLGHGHQVDGIDRAGRRPPRARRGRSPGDAGVPRRSARRSHPWRSPPRSARRVPASPGRCRRRSPTRGTRAAQCRAGNRTIPAGSAAGIARSWRRPRKSGP